MKHGMGLRQMMEPGYGRNLEFDERSRGYGIARLANLDRPLRSMYWRSPIVLNQGGASSCVGCAWAHELAAVPAEVQGIEYRFAERLYEMGKERDSWDGTDYDGTSVLAVAKALVDLGYIGGYRWAFGIEQVCGALAYEGPVVVGVPWHRDMEQVDGNGYVRATGETVAHHAVLLEQIYVPRERITLLNSWGSSWGNHGRAYISFDDLSKLLGDKGEACIPIDRNEEKLTVE